MLQQLYDSAQCKKHAITAKMPKILGNLAYSGVFWKKNAVKQKPKVGSTCT